MAIPWWIHPPLAATLITLTALTIYYGRKSAKAPTESYEPILARHRKLALTTIGLACVVVVLGPLALADAGVKPFETGHAFLGVTLVALWLTQGVLGWRLWNDHEKVRKFHRYNGFAILGLAFVQVAFGLGILMEFLE